MHSFTSSLHHCVFATKGREVLLTPDIRARLWPYLGGVARENGMKALAIGGVADHVHILLSVPATMSIAKAMQLLKGILPNGFMRRFQSFGASRGRKVMRRSALVFRELRRRGRIFAIRRSIIGRGPIGRRSLCF